MICFKCGTQSSKDHVCVSGATYGFCGKECFSQFMNNCYSQDRNFIAIALGVSITEVESGCTRTRMIEKATPDEIALDLHGEIQAPCGYLEGLAIKRKGAYGFSAAKSFLSGIYFKASDVKNMMAGDLLASPAAKKPFRFDLSNDRTLYSLAKYISAPNGGNLYAKYLPKFIDYAKQFIFNQNEIYEAVRAAKVVNVSNLVEVLQGPTKGAIDFFGGFQADVESTLGMMSSSWFKFSGIEGAA